MPTPPPLYSFVIVLVTHTLPLRGSCKIWTLPVCAVQVSIKDGAANDPNPIFILGNPFQSCNSNKTLFCSMSYKEIYLPVIKFSQHYCDRIIFSSSNIHKNEQKIIEISHNTHNKGSKLYWCWVKYTFNVEYTHLGHS